jgi:hypothetical protein
MPELLWAYENAAARDAGALPPIAFDAPYGRRTEPPSKDIQRAAALGRPVTPADCGPVRVIAQYGFAVRCPGRVTLRRAAQPTSEREFTDSTASYGQAVIGGSPWPTGDTGFVASWISGSEYVKIQTGIMLFFPRDVYLYQGPLPNSQLLPGPPVDVMAGMEYPSRDRQWLMGDTQLAWSSLNFIVRLPPVGETVRIEPGQPLGWIFPVLPRAALTLGRFTPEPQTTTESGDHARGI